MNIKPLTISVAASKAGIGVETIRYYQRIGLLSQPDKPEKGYRVYSESCITRLLFIKHAKELGFNLAEIEILLIPSNEKQKQTKELALRKLRQIKSKMMDLDYMASSLERLIQLCDEDSKQEEHSAIEILL